MKKVNDNPNSMIGKAHCDICHLALYSNKEVKKHKLTYHNPPYEECDNPRNPYRFCRNNNGYQLCLVYSCGWQHTNAMELIKHMCLMHSQLELSNFGVSRMYLKYIMGIRLPEMDIIRQTQIDPLGHISQQNMNYGTKTTWLPLASHPRSSEVSAPSGCTAKWRTASSSTPRTQSTNSPWTCSCSHPWSLRLSPTCSRRRLNTTKATNQFTDQNF